MRPKPSIRQTVPRVLLPTVCILILTVLLFSSGCVLNEPTQTRLFPQRTLETFASAITEKTHDADERTTIISHTIEDAASDEEIEAALLEFYIDNIKLTAVGYYDAQQNKTYITPFATIGTVVDLKKIYESFPSPEHRTFIYGPISTERHGTACAFAHPVYRGGEYTGIVVSLFDPVVFVTDAALSYEGLSDLGIRIIDTDGIIFYSSFGGNIGINIANITDVWCRPLHPRRFQK